MRDKVININVTEGAVDDFEPWESSEKKEETVENRKFCDKSSKNDGDNKVYMERHHGNVEELNCNRFLS